MYEISLGLLITLIVLSTPTALVIVFMFIYFLAGIRDLFFVRYKKPTEKEKNCPYEKDGNKEE